MTGRIVTVAVALMLVASGAWAGSVCPRQTQSMANTAANAPPPASTVIATEPSNDESVVATEEPTTATSN